MLESPLNSGGLSKQMAVNWTATYRFDSDIVTPYERFTLNKYVPKDQLKPEFASEPKKRNYAASKTKVQTEVCTPRSR